jgi:two-component system, OmpR family, phosphate regulon sensor histidine kinase PhoR
MSAERILLYNVSPDTARLLEAGILRPAGFEVLSLSDVGAVMGLVKVNPPDLIIIEVELPTGNSQPVDDSGCLESISQIMQASPILPVILLPLQHSESLERKALRLGMVDYLVPPIRASELLGAVRTSLERSNRLKDWIKLEAKRSTNSLKNRLEGLEALQRVGRSVTSLLDLDGVLKAVVDSAVELTGAEEGSLLLLDETTGELYMRAAKNFQDEFVRTFRLPIRDTLPGQVLRTARPLVIDERTPRKIKTAYLVHSLIYVPLQVQGRVIGVLGVDNRQSGHHFEEQYVTMMSALGDYAAIAIENANLYSRTEVERNKLETILTQVEDGVIVIDQDGRVALINGTACTALNLGDDPLFGKAFRDVTQNSDLIEILGDELPGQPIRNEVRLEDGRIFNAQLTPIQGIGIVITMQDITHLKELDRIKSDFVSTVSHDLRSPLTAILGYIELIDRVGPLNDQQREFIRRVQFSVNNITLLINDLLDLGRIEAGFDAFKEIVALPILIRITLEGLHGRLEEKRLSLKLNIPEELPKILGNPTRLRQMLSNLLTNAVKYTPDEGWISVYARAEGGQVILQISDNGPGIPAADQPYIFDKFYRASNVPAETPGTGLGLAIVKSIVEYHQGRIWVNSQVGHGATFTVVLPIAQEDE